MSIPSNTFIMVNPPLSSEVPSEGSQFHTMGNPQPEAPLAGGNIYNPHYVDSVGMVPIQPFMNQFGGYYPIRQGHGISSICIVAHIPANSNSHWGHISGHIQLCLVYISIHTLLLSSESEAYLKPYRHMKVVIYVPIWSSLRLM
jgi:hypothetical protein